MSELREAVAVVAGSTRGAGRGIACGLGEAGATVYCTGRSTAGNPSSYDRPETIDETAALVTEAGGTGIAVRVDHTVESEVAALFERINDEQSRLDVLVDSVGGVSPLLGGLPKSLVETDLQHASAAIEQSLVSHLFTARHAAPLMIAQKRGLIAQVIDTDMLFCVGNLLSQVVKLSLKGLAQIISEELYSHGVTSIAITPGFLRSESMLEHFQVTSQTWRDAGKHDKHFLESESPWFVGRGLASLAADPDKFQWTGHITSSWELGERYGITDIDGRRPDWGQHVKEVVAPTMDWYRERLERHADWLEGISSRARSYLAGP